MRTQLVSGFLSALIYCQALLVVAGLAAVMLRDRTDNGDMLRSAQSTPAITMASTI